jgi:hypothetical protein
MSATWFSEDRIAGDRTLPNAFFDQTSRAADVDGWTTPSTTLSSVVSNMISSQISRIRSPDFCRSFRTAAPAESRRKGPFSTQTGHRAELADRSLCPMTGHPALAAIRKDSTRSGRSSLCETWLNCFPKRPLGHRCRPSFIACLDSVYPRFLVPFGEVEQRWSGYDGYDSSSYRR